MYFFIKQSLNFLKNLCFPLTCCSCGDFIDTEGLCSNCWKKIKWISEPKCKICGLPFEIEIDGICASCSRKKPYFDKAISVFEYNEASKKIVLKFKNFDSTYMAKILANWMYRAAQVEFTKADVIIPVPIHFLKRLRRKYNQSELLARELNKLSHVNYKPNILAKIKRSHSQEGLNKQQRLTNLSGTFGMKAALHEKRVILVDDVLTTGTTANECSKLLKKHGAQHVTVVTIARVPI